MFQFTKAVIVVRTQYKGTLQPKQGILIYMHDQYLSTINLSPAV